MGSIVGHRIDYNGVGVLRGQRHIPSKTWPKYPPPPSDFGFSLHKDTKLRTFQFKFLHRRIGTNDFLYKVGIASNNLCSFCNLHVETLEHTFWSCPFTQAFWRNTTEWLNLKTPSLQAYHFPMSICLGLVPIPDKMLINQTLLIARHYIYVSRVRGNIPKQSSFIRLLTTTKEIEQNNTYKIGELDSKKWEILIFTK